MKNIILGLGVLAVAVAIFFGLKKEEKAEVVADCGKVVVGEMNWASGEFLARLDGLIMKEGYGCEVEYLTAGTMPQITSMNEKGTPDIASEIWANAAAVAIDAAIQENRLVKLNPSPITGAGEGWMMSAAAAAAHPELKTIDDIIARPDLFPHPEDQIGRAHV